MITLSPPEDANFRVSFNVSIYSENGAYGSLQLHANSEPVKLDAVKMAHLIVKAQQFLRELAEETAGS
jgi:hypothetical protein